jgi:hypothetical protein
VTTLLETKSWRYALADGAAGFVLGAATGGMVDVGGRAFFGRIAAARAQFASPSKLAEHVAKHSNEWTPALTQGQYLSRARHLLSRPAGGEILEKWRANGDMLRYNARTNEFAALDGETGAVKTLVRPKGEGRIGMLNNQGCRVACPCCGFKTLLSNGRHDQNADWEICPVCGWENDPVQREQPRMEGGANSVSLDQAKANYAAFGAIERSAVPHVRLPQAEER